MFLYNSVISTIRRIAGMKTIPGSRRRHHVVRVGIFLIAAALIAGIAGCGDGGNDNPPPQEGEIRTWYDLAAVEDNLASNYTLMNDLDSTSAGYEELASPTANGGKGWAPIGFMGGTASFTGTFDGQGYEICDLFINRPYPEVQCCDVGLVGVVGQGGVIKNIGVKADVTGWVSVGGLVGENWGTMSNCYSTGSVNGSIKVGGLVGGSFEGIVSNSYSTGNVTGCDWSVGGLVGFSRESIISNSHYNYDEVLINAESIITIGALFGEDFEEWLANDKFLDVNERLSQENGYYVVNNITDFKELLAFGQDNSLKFRLKNDLDLATEPDLYIPYLAGEFDGNGHKISNLSFSFDFISQVGLFGCLASGGKVTDLGVENVNITGDSNVGGLVGYNGKGTVSNSYSSGNVTGGDWSVGDVGGLVGFNDKGTVSNSYSTASVTSDNNVGGLVGFNEMGTVSNSYSTGSVTGGGDVGGLVGENFGTVSNSYSTGSVTGDVCVGGLVGQNGGPISNCYSTGNVTGGDIVGGLVGIKCAGGPVSNCYSTGSVTGDGEVGGLVGENWSPVNNSFWDTETSGQATSAGGTGKTTAQMKNIATFSGVGWDIIWVADPGTRNPSYIWNIVDDETYPFLSWQP